MSRDAASAVPPRHVPVRSGAFKQESRFRGQHYRLVAQTTIFVRAIIVHPTRYPEDCLLLLRKCHGGGGARTHGTFPTRRPGCDVAGLTLAPCSAGRDRWRTSSSQPVARMER